MIRRQALLILERRADRRNGAFPTIPFPLPIPILTAIPPPLNLLPPKLLQRRYRVCILGQRCSHLLQPPRKQPRPSQPPKLALLLHQHPYRNELGIALLIPRLAFRKRAQPSISLMRKVHEIALHRMQSRRQRFIFHRILELDIRRRGAFPTHSVPVRLLCQFAGSSLTSGM